MATHSSILAWKIPWTEEAGGLQSMGLQRVRHDRATNTYTYIVATAKSLQSCLSLCDPKDGSPPGSSVHGDSPGKNTRVCCHALLQGIFPTQGSNPGLPHCRQILYLLSHQGSPRILEWIVYPFSRGFSQPRNQTRSSRIAGGFFTR